ncbi:MAG TPA: DUF3160 domain-containing protein [Polyangium sp.]|nr:DUF3160 domain-containing protein [Polyangium sp.]
MGMSNHRAYCWRAMGLLGAIVLANCANSNPLTVGKPTPPIADSGPRSPDQLVAKNRSEDVHFRAYQTAHPNLTAADVLALLPKRTYRPKLDFDPSKIAHYDTVSKALQLTDTEKASIQKNGFVSVDFRQRLSMAVAYYAIYTADLPVFVTTDSIAHALHRSFDEMLKALEEQIFSQTLAVVLTGTREQLQKEAAKITDPTLNANLRDVDLYLSVALDLLQNTPAAPNEEGNAQVKPPPIVSQFGQEALVKTIVERIHDASAIEALPVYGGQRKIDYTQFKPRGHYAESDALKRYFRAMMWLGRSDTGWFLLPVDPQSGLQIDVPRERRNAAMMSYLMDKSGHVPRLETMSKVIDFLVGPNDSLTIDTMRTLFPRVQLQSLSDLVNPAVGQRLEQSVRELHLGSQRIRSQALYSDPHAQDQVESPALFQVFGQRFVVDSFVMSNVVFDSIVFEGRKQERNIPQGLDIVAALGNDEAVRLLEPELKKWNYGTNLMAARAVVESYAPAKWNESVYNVWLDALRTLDDDFPAGSAAPQLMQTQAWQHKQLQTQLASWAELRHDTILYAKQSYGAVTACEYPTGYVEPYPQFFKRLEFLALETVRLLKTIDVSNSDPNLAPQHAALRQLFVDFWTNFATVVHQLQTLAQKELDAQPFTPDEIAFIKKTIDIRGGGSGPPHYDGWYPQLIFGSKPAAWKPTIADVHTGFEQEVAKVVEVGVGDVTLLVAAVDNQGDRMVYVGPMSSYYEFTQTADKRMTDEEWGTRISDGQVPARPAWTSSFQPQLQLPAKSRDIKAEHRQSAE